MLRACRQGHTLTLFTDEFRCPLPAGAVARAVWELLGQQAAGLYHLGGSERLSRWDIAQALAQRYPDLMPCLHPGFLSSYTGPPRPADLSMRSDKLQSLLSFPLPGWRQWLTSVPHTARDPWDYPGS
jgi:dTDP-4-dehydrorhamnose reductase